MSRIIEAEPIEAQGRTLRPLVLASGFVRRRAMLSGEGAPIGEVEGFIHMRPIALVEQTPAGQQRLPIRDANAQAILRLLLLIALIPLLAMLVVHLFRRPN